MKFREYNLKESLKRGLDNINFIEPTPVQQIVIPKLLKGENVIGKSATGTGKTHAFIIPLLQNLDEETKEVQKIIISPTRELAEQIYQEIVKLIDLTVIDCRMFVGGTNREQEIKRLEKSQPQIIVSTLGKLLDLAINTNILKIHTANMIVIDEADMVFVHKEIEDIDKIFSKLTNNIQISVFSATITEELIKFLNKYLSKCKIVDLKDNESLTKSAINHIFIPTKNKDKGELLVSLLNSFTPYLVLIFANTKDQVNLLADFLANRSFKVAKITGDLESRERKQILKRIKDGEFKYVVASDIASRGLDIEGVSHVINYELPKDIEFFIHRVGRTARYDSNGIAISFYDYDDDKYINLLQNRGLKCTYMSLKNGSLVVTNERNRRKQRKVIKIEEELHLKTPMPKKVKPGYKKKRKAEIEHKLKIMKRKRIDSLYYHKEHKENMKKDD